MQNSRKHTPVILGRPFLATADANINCRTGVMEVSFRNMKVRLNAFRASHQPPDQDECFAVDVVDELVENDLHPEDTLPVIIAPDLSDGQEAQILEVWHKHKSALGSSVADLKDINPSICIPHIPCIDDFPLSRGMQQVLVPNLEEVDMKEVLSHVFIVLAANIPQVLWSELGGVLPVFLHSTFC